jgi:hypothetical protein
MPSPALICEFHGDRPLGADACPRSLSRTMGYRDNACERHLGTAAIHFASYKFEQRRQLGCAMGGRGFGGSDKRGALPSRALAHSISASPSMVRLLRRKLPANRRDLVGVELTTATVGLWSVLRLRSGPATKQGRPIVSAAVRGPSLLWNAWDPIRIIVIMEPTRHDGIAAGGAGRRISSVLALRRNSASEHLLRRRAL